MLDVRSFSVNIDGLTRPLPANRQTSRGSLSRTLSIALSIVFCVALAMSASAADCTDTPAEPDYSLEVVAPLMAHLGPALRLAVLEDGCVVAEYPSYYAQPGKFAFRLEPGELQRLRSELDGLRLQHIDRAVLSAEVDAARTRLESSPRIEYVVADGNMVRIRIGSRTGPSHGIFWGNLDQDLLNFPEIEGLVSLAAARDRLQELQHDPRMEKLP
jgi:hypothetical protein